MIRIDRQKGYIVISRCEYLYRDGLEKRDEKGNREMGDGDIIIPLPPHMVDTKYDHTGRTDGQNAVTIIEEIARRLSGQNAKSEAVPDGILNQPGIHSASASTTCSPNV